MLRKHAALLILALTVGCIDVPAVDSIMNNILPDEEIIYQQATLMEADGSFAPESSTNESVLQTAFEAFLEDPFDFEEVFEDISWEEYEHKFTVPENSRFLVIEVKVDYEALGGEDVNAGPAGSFDCSITSPDDREFCEGYTLANWNDRDDGLEISWIIPCPSIVGEWNIKVSGSGMEGLPGIAYSGTYEIKVKSEILVSG